MLSLFVATLPLPLILPSALQNTYQVHTYSDPDASPERDPCHIPAPTPFPLPPVRSIPPPCDPMKSPRTLSATQRYSGVPL